jgi:single-strand DNA-binding protein
MSDLNRVAMIGRLTKDIEVKHISTGTAVANFSIANNRIIPMKDGNKEKVSYFDCVVWGKQAEILAQYCKKGNRIAVEGKLDQQVWEKDGKKNYRIEILVDNFQFLESNKSGVKEVFNGVEVTDNPFKDEIPF